MYSFSFPKMFNQTNANLVEDKEAIKSDMFLLISSEQQTLFGDPYFGCQLKKYFFEQSNSIVPDLLIDHLYSTIAVFMPQVILRRNDIKVYVQDKTIYADIKYYYTIDNSSDLFTIPLTEFSEE